MFNRIKDIDEKVTSFIENSASTRVLDILMKWITFLGDYACVWIALALVLISSSNYKEHGYFIIATIGVTTCLTELVVKNIAKRSRPVENKLNRCSPIKIPKSYSFPSGHTATSFAVILPALRVHTVLGVIVFVIATAIGFSRIYLKVHYLTDVLAGAFFGSLVSIMLLLC